MSDEQTNEQSKAEEQTSEKQVAEKPVAAEPEVEDFAEKRRRDPSAVRTMSASSFKIPAEPKAEPKPPVQETRPPVQEPPVQESKPPAQEMKPPVQEVKPPVQESRSPVQETRPPAQEVKPPVQEPRPPTQEVKPPVQEPRPPAQEVKPPVQEPRPPVQETRPPVQEPRVVEPEPMPQTQSGPENVVPPQSAPREEQTQQGRSRPWDHIGPANSASDGNILDAFKGAISFFTLLKFNVGEKEQKALGRNMFVAPIIGAVMGIVLALISIVLWLIGVPTVLIAAVVVGGSLVLSKFIHFDGLVDFGDGMAVSGNREDHIRALKDSAIGAGGMGLAFVVVLVSFAGLASISDAVFMISIAIITTEIFSKNGMVAAAVFGKPGNGMAAEQVSNSNIMTLIVSTVLSVGLAIGLFFAIGILTVALSPLPSVDMLWSAIGSIGAAAVMSILSGLLVSFLAERNFGYVNGDCLGAAHEISRALTVIVTVCVIFAVAL